MNKEITNDNKTMTKNILILMDDVHLEGRPPETIVEFSKVVNDKINETKLQGLHPIVVCAGDIGENIEGVKWASQFKTDVIYVCGNHEFWNGDFYEIPENIQQFISKKENEHIKFLDKGSCVINGTRFIGATLWTALGDFLPWYNKNFVVRFFGAMGDFKRTTAKKWYTPSNIARFKTFMQNNGVEEDKINDVIANQLFNPLIEIEENQKSIQYFINELSQSHTQETVVISHHLPVYQLWMKKMKMSPDNLSGDITNNEKFFLDCAKGNVVPSKDMLMMSFYVNNLKDLMYGKYAPDYWLHGHLHQEMEEIVGRTKIISSPVGYHRQSKEMKLKQVPITKNYKFVVAYTKKEIEAYSWTDKLYDNLRQLEQLILKFELCINIGVVSANDFEPILSSFQKNHSESIKELKIKTNEWLKHLLYANNPEIIDKDIDIYLVKKVLGFSDTKYKFPDQLVVGVNEYSFLSEDKFKSHNQGELQYYHYKDWLKEMQKIHIQISQYKKSLLSFCDDFLQKNS